MKLFKVQQAGQTALLALSSRSWLLYNYQTQFHMTPLSYQALEYASGFSSEQVMEGLVSIAGDTLRIITIDQLGDKFNQTAVPLSYTPRKCIVDPVSGFIITIETDHNAFNAAEKAELKAADAEEEAPEAQIGAAIPEKEGKWASCIRVVHPGTGDTLSVLELDGNEAAFSLSTVVFHDRGGEVFLLVGTAKDMTLHPRKLSCGFVHVYRLIAGRKKLQFVHKTKLEDVPLALAEFQGHVLVGCGKAIRLYDLGKRKLLRKAQNANFPTTVTNIKTSGCRIFVGDMHEGVTVCKFKRATKEIIVFADEVVPRRMSSMELLDYDTYFGSDKFGNAFVSRLSDKTNEDVLNPTGNRMLWDTGLLNGAPNKMEVKNCFHVGETVTCSRKTRLCVSGDECVVVGTVMGGIGAFVPFKTRDNVDFFTQLEMCVCLSHLHVR